jgi:hypothetical protein
MGLVIASQPFVISASAASRRTFHRAACTLLYLPGSVNYAVKVLIVSTSTNAVLVTLFVVRYEKPSCGIYAG